MIQREVYRFGNFRLDPVARTLTSDGAPVKLRPQEWVLLLVLVECATAKVPTVATKDQLQQRIWGNIAVGAGSLPNTVLRLRNSLDPPPQGQSYVGNVPNVGYYLTVDVWKEEIRVNRPSIFRPNWVVSMVLAVLVVAAVLASTLRIPYPPAAVNQITDDGTDKAGPLWPDGDRIYFTERDNAIFEGRPTGVNVPAWVSVGSKSIMRMEVPGVAELRVLDVSGPGRQFLLEGRNAQNQYYLWSWKPGQPARPLIASNSTEAVWTSDDAFVEVTDGRLVFVDHGVVLKTTAVLGNIRHLRWSASRRALRFSLFDAGLNHATLWEMVAGQDVPRPLGEYPPDAVPGSWGANGRFFAFTVPNPKTSDIWLGVNKGRARPTVPDKLIRLTEGPLYYDWPVPSPDDSLVFAIGTTQRWELVSYQSDKRVFRPYLDGRSACELDFSKDGQWLTYVKYRERTLWRSRADGTDAIQLTWPPLEAIEPHWSPDGSQIAFTGVQPDGSERIYLIPAQGGKPLAATLGRGSEGVPTWSPDGSTIVFGDLLQGKPESMSIHFLDVKRQVITNVPGSEGLWSPRWSPDGAFISALTPDFKKLKLYDCRRGVWKDLVSLDNIDQTHWGADSASIYFQGVVTNQDPKVGPQLAIYRLNVRRRKLEMVADLDDFPMTGYAWFGITPDGTPLGLRGLLFRELYSIPYPR